MKFTSALASVAGLAVGTSLTQQYGDDYATYFQYPDYVTPEYTAEYTNGALPGPDYNRQCYEFDTCDQIFT